MTKTAKPKVKKEGVKKSRVSKKAKVQVESAPQLEVKQGSYVLYVSQDILFGENPTMKKAREIKHPGTVTLYNPDRCIVSFAQISTVTRSFGASIHPSNLKAISAQEFNDIIELQRKVDSEEEEKMIKKKYQKFYDTPHLPLMERIIGSQGDKNLLSTGMNFIEQGTITNYSEAKDPSQWKFSLAGWHEWASCCALTKNTYDLRVFVPELWITYYGYNLDDIRQWMEFLKDCDMGFEYHIEEIAPMSQYHNVRAIDSNNQIMTPSCRVIPIIMKGHKSQGMISYLRFICIRYLYNVAYWPIPHICMQMKEALGDRISNWDILIIAHLYESYSGGYALFSSYHGNQGEVHTPVANPVKEILKRITDNNMNGSFHTQNIGNSFLTTIRSQIRKKRWEELYTLVQPYLNTKKQEK
jgi:hypothetical protein